MTVEQEIDYLEGSGFYTRRTAPKDWDYEEYLAELNKMANLRKSIGLKDDYYRMDKQSFLEHKKQTMWGMPAPEKGISAETRRILDELAELIEAQNDRLNQK